MRTCVQQASAFVLTALALTHQPSAWQLMEDCCQHLRCLGPHALLASMYVQTVLAPTPWLNVLHPMEALTVLEAAAAMLLGVQPVWSCVPTAPVAATWPNVLMSMAACLHLPRLVMELQHYAIQANTSVLMPHVQTH
jgi:hypothetical protein